MAAGAPKIKNFFKTKGKQYGKDLLASYKGDLNGKILEQGLGIGISGRNRYNLKIADGLQDLLHGTLGIRTSNVQNIEQNVRGMIEQDRAQRVEKSIASPGRVTAPPAGSNILQFPNQLYKDDGKTFDPMYRTRGQEFGQFEETGAEFVSFPNQIHFRSLIRRELETMPANYDELFSDPLIDDAHTSANPRVTKWRKWWNDTRNQQSWRSTIQSKEVVYDVFLYLPKQLSDSVKVTYANEGMGPMEATFARFFSGFDANDLAATQGLLGKGNADIDEWLKFLRGMLPGGKVIQMATGNMVNPMKFQTLEGVDFRTYTYKFTLRPKDAEEASEIRDIVYAFKYSMLPGVAGYNAKLWTFPNEWAIRFQGPIKQWIDFPLTCVCTGCDVDYGGGGNVTTFIDGAPTAIDLTLTFTETIQLSRQRFAEQVAPRPFKSDEKGLYGTRDERMVEREMELTRYGTEVPEVGSGGPALLGSPGTTYT